MERSFGAVLRLLAATAVVIAALGLGFVAASASSDPADPVDEMHAAMSARLSEQDRALHDRMHEGCSGHTDERNTT